MRLSNRTQCSCQSSQVLSVFEVLHTARSYSVSAAMGGGRQKQIAHAPEQWQECVREYRPADGSAEIFSEPLKDSFPSFHRSLNPIRRAIHREERVGGEGRLSSLPNSPSNGVRLSGMRRHPAHWRCLPRAYLCLRGNAGSARWPHSRDARSFG